ncbi:MAG TPA: hypothetical protein VF989_10915 [Polyangiaceae bacterium]
MPRRARRVFFATTALAPLVWAVPARADDPTPQESPRPTRGFAALTRPTGMAEVGLGWLTLPRAEVCVERSASGCERGDTSPIIEVWQLYRPNLRWAVGAGITLGLIPTQDAPRREIEGIERDHRRGYFLFEAASRYYPYVGERVEAWVGLLGGLVVVSDKFSSDQGFDQGQALIGPRGVTLSTEGYSLGLGAGVAVRLAQHWSAGAALRYGTWFLPAEPQTDPLGDEASLTGQNSAFTLGVNISYRTEL